MTLYESNFIRLGWLVPDLKRLHGSRKSVIAGEPALELSVMEQSRYTTSLQMTYLFGEGAAATREPELEIRVYHDARLAEACGTGATPSHSHLRQLSGHVARNHGERWSCNMLLNKWLEYCVGNGHRFAAPAA